MRLVIDHATRDEVRSRFGINNSDMTRILKYEYNNVVARQARAYILNFKEFLLIEGSKQELTGVSANARELTDECFSRRVLSSGVTIVR